MISRTVQAHFRSGKDQAMTIKRHGVGPRLSQAVVHGDTVYLAGMVASDPSADAKGQTQQILKKIDETLARSAATSPSSSPPPCTSPTWASTPT